MVKTWNEVRQGVDALKNEVMKKVQDLKTVTFKGCGLETYTIVSKTHKFSNQITGYDMKDPYYLCLIRSICDVPTAILFGDLIVVTEWIPLKDIMGREDIPNGYKLIEIPVDQLPVDVQNNLIMALFNRDVET